MLEAISFRSPITLALLATAAWGVWALFIKLATRTGRPEVVLLILYTVAIAVGIGFFLTNSGGVVISQRDFGFAVLAGLATGLGSAFYYTGLQYGSVGRVSTIVGLYFVVTVVLGVLVLNESLTLQKVAGIGFAAIAVVLLSCFSSGGQSVQTDTLGER